MCNNEYRKFFFHGINKTTAFTAKEQAIVPLLIKYRFQITTNVKVHHAKTTELAKTVSIDTIAHVYVDSPAETARRVGYGNLVI